MTKHSNPRLTKPPFQTERLREIYPVQVAKDQVSHQVLADSDKDPASGNAMGYVHVGEAREADS